MPFMPFMPFFQFWRVLIGLCVSFMLVSTGGMAWAQTYSYRNDTFAYDTPSASASTVTWHAGTDGNWLGSPVCTNYPNGDDDWADIAFPAGFTFTFGATPTVYSSVRVYSNGMLKFGTDPTGWWTDYTPSTTLPDTVNKAASTGNCTTGGTISNTMIGYWVDLVAGTGNATTGASLKYELLGTAPNRRLVISWVNVRLYSNTNRFNFQIALYESPAGSLNSNFKYQYTSGSSTGSGALVGVQVNTSDATLYAYDQLFIDPATGSAVWWYPSNQAIPTQAAYRFDENSWSGIAGEIKDSSGNNLHATRIGTTNTTSANGGKICNGGTFTSNTSATTIDAVATPITPINQGSVDFWYKSTQAWNVAATMLLDTTTTAAKPFYLMKKANGGLQFTLADSAGAVFTVSSPTNYTYAAGTWHHIGVTWNLRPGTNQTLLQMFVDGVLVRATRTTSNGAIASGLSTFYIGDNRTSGITPSSGTANGAYGVIDEVNFYNVEASASQIKRDFAATRTTCATLNHFHIIHNGTAASCSTPQNITIEAHDANHALYPLQSVQMSLSTTPAHGTWSQVTGGSINVLTAVGVGTGTANYTFSTDATHPNGESSVTFGLSNPLTESLTIHATLGAVTEVSGTAAVCVAQDYTFGSACNAAFTFNCAINPAGFNCVEAGAAAATGHLYTKLAGTAFAMDVVALKADGVTVESGFASYSAKPITVELVDGSGATACTSRSALSPAVASITQNFVAADAGRKSFSFTTPNAYRDVRCRVTDTNQIPNVVSCSADDFAIRPSAVTLNTAATATAPSATATPTVKAGANFTLSATTSTGTNYAPTLTQNTSKLTAQDPTQVVQASGGNLGTLAPANLTVNAAAVNATYSEVGYLYLAAGAYYDAANPAFTVVDSNNGDCIAGSFSDTLIGGQYGCNIGNATTVSLGRFIPDHFDTAIVSTATAPIPCPSGLVCPTNISGSNGLIYATQPFSVQVTAKNAVGITTQNYRSNFAKATTLSAWNAVGGTTPNPGGSTLSNTALAATAFANGVGSTALPSYALGSVTTAPTDVFIRAAENAGGDGVTSKRASGTVEAGIKIASGRIKIPNAYGSERLRLPITATVQYYTGNYWATSLTDSVSSFHTALSPTGNLVVSSIVGLGGSLSVLNPAAAAVTNGVRIFHIAIPNAVGRANLSLNAPLYLPSTTGLVNFGLYKSTLIDRRENY